MDDLHRMHDDLEKVIEKDDSSSTVTGSDCEETFREGPPSLRQKLEAIVCSRKFQVVVLVLVLVDMGVVVGELLVDLELVKLGKEHEEVVPHALHYCSLAILSIFMVEIAVRIFVLRLRFFKHKFEMFDAFVVVTSFVLDIVFRNSQDAAAGVSLLIVLRLWRFGRIINGLTVQIRHQAEKKVQRERHLREACEQELGKFRAYCTSLEGEVDYLRRLLKDHAIPYTEKVQKRPEGRQISVQAEVNHTLGQHGAGEVSHSLGQHGAGEVNHSQLEAGEVSGAATAAEHIAGVGAGSDPCRSAMNGLADVGEGKAGRRTGDGREMDVITVESSLPIS